FHIFAANSAFGDVAGDRAAVLHGRPTGRERVEIHRRGVSHICLGCRMARYFAMALLRHLLISRSAYAFVISSRSAIRSMGSSAMKPRSVSRHLSPSCAKTATAVSRRMQYSMFPCALSSTWLGVIGTSLRWSRFQFMHRRRTVSLSQPFGL